MPGVAYAVAMAKQGDQGYERLDPEKVNDTLAHLHDRIAESFPGRHLADVAVEVSAVVDKIDRQSSDNLPVQRLVRWGSRIAIALLVVLIGVAIGSAIRTGQNQVGDVRAFEWLQYVESGVNDVVFAALAIYFLISVPNRIRRRRVLETLQRLRSLAHIVDMHQMTKDPDELLPRHEGGRTPTGVMNRVDFARYLDYCSALLTLTSKAAALCAEESTDPIVLDTVSEIENLTTGMSRKIWQKISLLHTPDRTAQTTTTGATIPLT